MSRVDRRVSGEGGVLDSLEGFVFEGGGGGDWERAGDRGARRGGGGVCRIQQQAASICPAVQHMSIHVGVLLIFSTCHP